MIETYRHRPTRVKAACYDGTIDAIDILQAWVRKTNPRQRVEPEGEDGRMVLISADGTNDLLVGWWLVFNERDEFEVMTPDEFGSVYEE